MVAILSRAGLIPGRGFYAFARGFSCNCSAVADFPPCVSSGAQRQLHRSMPLTILFHPLTTFAAGLLVALIAVSVLLKIYAAPNRSFDEVAAYENFLSGTIPNTFVGNKSDEAAAIKRFTEFLQKISDPAYLRENTAKVYSADAYLDDTLVIHHGAPEIEAYFTKTSQSMTYYEVVINDVASSGSDYYVHWTMTFAAPALSGGAKVRSVGVSQIRFDSAGKVALHRDFWDSGRNFFAHLPVAGGIVGFIHKKLKEPTAKPR